MSIFPDVADPPVLCASRLEQKSGYDPSYVVDSALNHRWFFQPAVSLREVLSGTVDDLVVARSSGQDIVHPVKAAVRTVVRGTRYTKVGLLVVP